MSKKKRGLGRGLDALIAGSKAAAVAVEPEAEVALETQPAGERPQPAAAQPIRDGELRHLPLEWIQPGQYQPRKDIQPEALEELAASIKAQGLMQPIVVRPDCRWQCCRAALRNHCR